MLERTRPIIVGGCHRSGTSLVRRVLNAHSAIHCGPEVKFFRDFYGHYADDPWAGMRFFATARTLVDTTDLLAIAGAAFAAMHACAAEHAGKRRWADKSPENVLHLDDWSRILNDHWIFLHVVRHPLDTLASIKEIGFRRTIPTDLEGRIAWYRRFTEAGLRFAATRPDRYRRVVYEMLATRPDDGIRALMRDLDESPEPAQLTFNQIPQQPGLEDPKVSRTSRVHSDSVGRWRTLLTEDEAGAIWEGTRDLWQQIDPSSGTDHSGMARR
jgi:hypothetical protein